MHDPRAAVLSAVTVVAVLGLAGCSDPAPPAPAQGLHSTFDVPQPTTTAFTPAVAPLPPPDALTGLLYRLTDTSIPAEQKMVLVQYATADDQPALTNFGEALKANGFDPLTIQIADEAWAGDPGHVIGTVTMGSPNPKIQPVTFPMEFSPMRDFWQLSRKTADQLLPLAKKPPPPPRP